MSDIHQTRVVDVWVSCGSHKPLNDADLHSFTVDQDLSQPDMCTLQLKNNAHKFSNGVTLGDEVEIKITVNTGNQSDKFNGKYFLTGCSHS